MYQSVRFESVAVSKGEFKNKNLHVHDLGHTLANCHLDLPQPRFDRLG